MKKKINLETLINVLLEIKENDYSMKLMEKFCDDYFFEEGEIVFGEDFIKDYNFLMIFFQENLAKLDNSKYTSIIDFLIKSLGNKSSREEILIVLYFDYFLDLQQKLDYNKINKETFNTQVKKIIGEDFDLNRVVIVFNRLVNMDNL